MPNIFSLAQADGERHSRLPSNPLRRGVLLRSLMVLTLLSALVAALFISGGPRRDGWPESRVKASERA